MLTVAVFATRKGFYPLAWILKLFQGKSHCAIIHFLSDGRKVVSEMVGHGFQLVLFDEWIKGYRINSRYYIRIESSGDHSELMSTIDDLRSRIIKDHGVTSSTKYAHFQLLLSGIEVIAGWLRLPELAITMNGSKMQICTEWLARFYDRYGLWKGDRFFDIISITECENEIKKVAI